jgi:hypothetical protein
MSSTTDFLTTNKNGVVAINNLNQTIAAQTALTEYLAGQYTSSAQTTAAVISAASGYLVSFNVIVAGAAGTINNTTTTGGIASGNALCATPATVGIYPVGVKFSSGLVVNPGAGQTITVTYSLD